MRLPSSFGSAQRIAVIVGFAAVLGALGRYLESLGRPDLVFGWFAYAPLESTGPVPSMSLDPAIRLAIWAGACAVWAIASVRLVGSAAGRRIVLVVALAGVLFSLGDYLSTLGGTPHGPGLQYLSTEQLTQYGARLAPGLQLLVWSGLAVVWTVGALLLLSRGRSVRSTHD